MSDEEKCCHSWAYELCQGIGFAIAILAVTHCAHSCRVDQLERDKWEQGIEDALKN